MLDPWAAGELEELDRMFVQSAFSVECSPGYFILQGISPSTVYVSDQPRHQVGHIDTPSFIAAWGTRANGLADKPHAVLAFSNADNTGISATVMTISHPYLRDGNLSYEAQVLDGQLPASASSCTLFIDPFGRLPGPRAGRRTLRRTTAGRRFYFDD